MGVAPGVRAPTGAGRFGERGTFGVIVIIRQPPGS